jgi:hypothetical protein
MGTLEVDKLDPQSGTALEIGTSGDTATIPSGATLTVAGTLNVTGSITATDKIDSAHYAAGSIDNEHIADDAINSEHYADGSIDLAHMSSQSVDEDNLYISNSGSNGQYLQKQSGNSGGLTWAAAGGDLSFGGDTFGANKVIGANDAYSFSLETSGNTALTIDANGHITKPLQSAFCARPASDQSNIPASRTLIAFGTEVFDNNADFASSVFTAPVTGKYQLTLQLQIDQADADLTYLDIEISTSNRTYRIYPGPPVTDGDYYVGSGTAVSVITDMDASDTASCYIEQYGGSTTADIRPESSFSGYLVC